MTLDELARAADAICRERDVPAVAAVVLALEETVEAIAIDGDNDAWRRWVALLAEARSTDPPAR